MSIVGDMSKSCAPEECYVYRDTEYNPKPQISNVLGICSRFIEKHEYHSAMFRLSATDKPFSLQRGGGFWLLCIL